MSYELINKELNIWSCSISGLTLEQKNTFLDKQVKGFIITGSAIVFYDSLEDRIVINKDLGGLEEYLYIIEAYLSLSGEQRKEYKSCLNNIKFNDETSEKAVDEFLGVIDAAISIRHMKDMDKILGQQFCRLDKVQEFEYIKNKNKNEIFAVVDAFNYGYIEGIRAERAKRKAKKKSMERVIKAMAE